MRPTVRTSLLTYTLRVMMRVRLNKSLRIPEAEKHKSQVVQVGYATKYDNYVLYVHASDKCKFRNLN